MPLQDQYSALHAAAASGHLGVVAALLELGASMEAANRAGNTALHTATLNGHVDVVQEMLQEWEGCGLDSGNHQGHSALHLAAAATHSEPCLQLLLREGAKVGLRSSDGRSPLHFASDYGQLEVIEFLVTKVSCSQILFTF